MTDRESSAPGSDGGSDDGEGPETVMEALVQRVAGWRQEWNRVAPVMQELRESLLVVAAADGWTADKDTEEEERAPPPSPGRQQAALIRIDSLLKESGTLPQAVRRAGCQLIAQYAELLQLMILLPAVTDIVEPDEQLDGMRMVVAQCKRLDIFETAEEVLKAKRASPSDDDDDDESEDGGVAVADRGEPTADDKTEGVKGGNPAISDALSEGLEHMARLEAAIGAWRQHWDIHRPTISEMQRLALEICEAVDEADLKKRVDFINMMGTAGKQKAPVARAAGRVVMQCYATLQEWSNRTSAIRGDEAIAGAFEDLPALMETLAMELSQLEMYDTIPEMMQLAVHTKSLERRHGELLKEEARMMEEVAAETAQEAAKADDPPKNPSEGAAAPASSPNRPDNPPPTADEIPLAQPPTQLLDRWEALWEPHQRLLASIRQNLPMGPTGPDMASADTVKLTAWVTEGKTLRKETEEVGNQLLQWCNGVARVHGGPAVDRLRRRIEQELRTLSMYDAVGSLLAATDVVVTDV